MPEFYSPPRYGQAFVFFVSLVDQTNTKLFKASPTLVAGDVRISKDGGSFANLATLPSVLPAGGKAVRVSLSATEMQADNAFILFSDVAGNEWCDLGINLQVSKIGDSAVTIIRGTVDTAVLTPTQTQFDTSLTEATTNHYRRRVVIFTSGALVGQASDITAYSLQAGRGRITVSAMTEAPANGDSFVIV